MAHLLSASILSADFENLQNICELVNASEADYFHLDVMDGVFVPNISFGFPVIKAIAKHAKKPLDFHLMIIDPNPYLERFRDAGANTITIHFETCPHVLHSIYAIRKSGVKVCVAINPETPIVFLSKIIMNIDSVCLMTVNPGFGGQKFIGNSMSRLRELKELINLSQSRALIKVDGGIDLNNYAEVVNAGADILVAGTAVFGAKEPIMAIAALKKVKQREISAL